jgi:hypothetical protein
MSWRLTPQALLPQYLPAEDASRIFPGPSGGLHNVVSALTIADTNKMILSANCDRRPQPALTVRTPAQGVRYGSREIASAHGGP